MPKGCIFPGQMVVTRILQLLPQSLGKRVYKQQIHFPSTFLCQNYGNMICEWYVQSTIHSEKKHAISCRARTAIFAYRFQFKNSQLTEYVRVLKSKLWLQIWPTSEWVKTHKKSEVHDPETSARHNKNPCFCGKPNDRPTIWRWFIERIYGGFGGGSVIVSTLLYNRNSWDVRGI